MSDTEGREGVSHERLAKALGVSVATVRQARLNPEAKAHRSPPDQWRRVIAELAEGKIAEYRKLIEGLEAH